MASLTEHEDAILANEVAAVGGEFVPRGLGFGPQATFGADVAFVKSDEYVDFLSPADADGRLLKFSELPGNQIHAGLAKLDQSLTPLLGLRRLNEDRKLIPLEFPVKGRALLLVHGTFSSSENILRPLQEKNPAFLRWALKAYEGRVLWFDYPTLSQQALASAMALRRLVTDMVDGPIDVISHSQGGLVTRFWLEALDSSRLAETRAVFVAGTLAGTSLAAPWALRRAMKALANVAWVLAKGSSAASAAIPFFGALAGLFALLEKTTNFLSKAPAVDAGVALVPGFSGMSQVATNAELLELQRRTTSVPPGYFAITGDFEPPKAGWAFWKHFFSRVADGSADLLFRAPNDLVVDTAAMTHLADGKVIPKDRTHHFNVGEAPVHHTNYFQQRSTADMIQRWLGPQT